MPDDFTNFDPLDRRHSLHDLLRFVKYLEARFTAQAQALREQRQAAAAASPTITIPVPSHIPAAWHALPPEQRASYAQAMVEAWLEPLTRGAVHEPVFIPFHTVSTPPAGPPPSSQETPLPALDTWSDEALASLIHHAERLLEVRWPSPPLTPETAPLFEADRQHPETNAALYYHDFYRWCTQTAHLARQGTLAAVALQTLAAGMDDAMAHQWSALAPTWRALLGWLLVWAYAPKARATHAWWYVRITSYRTDLDILLRRSPVLRHKLAKECEEAYRRACEVAADDLGWGEDVAWFPASCPWTVEQILDAAFWPDEDAPHSAAHKER